MTQAEYFASLQYEDYRNLTTKEIEDLVKRGSKVLNPRIDRLSRHITKKIENGEVKYLSKDIATDAYKSVMKSGGKFGYSKLKAGLDLTKDKNKYRNRLIRELNREIKFARLKTSSVKQARVFKKEMKSIVMEAYGDTFNDLTLEDQNKIISDAWEEFHRQQELKPEVPSQQLVIWFKEKYDELNQAEMTQYLKEKSNEYNAAQQKKREDELKLKQDTEYKPKWKNPF